VKKNGPEENLNKTNTGKQSRNKQFSCTGKFLSKRKGKNQELFLCMNLVKPRGDSWEQFHSPWSSQKPSPAWLVFFFPSSFPFYMFSSFCIQSFRERVEEREKERGKGWRNNRGRNAAAAARGEFTKAG